MEDAIKYLREASRQLEKKGNKKIRFPELMPGDGNYNDEEQEQINKIFRAANRISKHGNFDRGTDVECTDLAALIHYIADTMEE